MPKPREEIKRERQSGLPWISPRFGDGGWHSTAGCISFDPREILPTGDHILVELDSEVTESGLILKPEIALNQERNWRTGTVLKVGPGKRPKQTCQFCKDRRTQNLSRCMCRDIYIGDRIPLSLKPGDRVIVGQFADWESWDADWATHGNNIAIFQEADVRLIID